jgi:hypothetical protein
MPTAKNCFYACFTATAAASVNFTINQIQSVIALTGKPAAR